jgi:amino acid adenylation domain-containing protein
MRRRVLEEWPAGGGLDGAEEGDPRPFVPVMEMIEARAAAAPDAVALAGDGERTPYGELNRRANQLAHHLRGLGVGPDAVVGLCLERSADLLVGMLGILKAGGAYLPLDPAHPADRLAWMLDDARARVVVTRRRFADAMDDGTRTFVRLDGDRADIARRPAADLRAGVDGESLAYVIYTSGSTGRPKGTMIRHAALSNHTASAADAYALTEGDRVLQFASATFDASVEEIFPTLARGAALVLRPERVLGAVAELLGFCAREGTTVLNFPTAYWHQLAAELRDGELALPPCVRVVIIGGERALPDRVAAWAACVPPSVALVNTYGPTETTVVATRHRVAGPDADGEVPIGRPIRGLSAYVLDGRMRPVPPGVVGELCLGGAGLARGYLGRPALTAERFVPDPFSRTPGARLYATGDRARHRAGGALEFAGRVDGQVKVRGYRVEPGEVESAVAQHPDVRAAAVAAREDVPGQRRLVAYVEAHRDPAPSPRELREFLRELLPEFMVPSAFVFLPALPLTPGGKVDRRALPAPGDAPSERAYRAPRTAAEEVLARVWAGVLGRERVGADDNFFELGGDSILAVQALSRAAQAGVRLSPRQLFAHPTLADLAAAARVDAPAPPLEGAAEAALQAGPCP